jgi:hypothetical protein
MTALVILSEVAGSPPQVRPRYGGTAFTQASRYRRESRITRPDASRSCASPLPSGSSLATCAGCTAHDRCTRTKRAAAGWARKAASVVRSSHAAVADYSSM